MKPKSTQTEAELLRQKAEKKLRKQESKASSMPSEIEIRKLYHELQVHQIELEIQNQELLIAKEKAEKSELIFKSLFEQNSTAIAVSEPDTTISYVNNEYCKITGYTREEIIGTSWTKNIFPADLERLKAYNQKRQIGSSEVPDNLEFRLIRKNREIRNALMFISTLGDNRIIASTVDITARKKAEKEVKKNKKTIELLYNRLADIREEERILLSREIHDQLGQSLSALKIDIGWLSGKIPSDSKEGGKMKAISELLTSTIEDVQRISSELHPAMLIDLGLGTTIEWYCGEFKERTGINFEYKLDDNQIPDEKISLALYRILQEALTNVMRHANAKNVNISLFQANGSIIMEVIDDGIGLKKEKLNSSKSLGFIGMRERAKKYNGTVNISSTLKKGTKLNVSIPLN